MEKNKEQKTIETPVAEFKTLRVFVEGRNYKTTYTKKFEERKLWVAPNPEELKSFLPGTIEKILVKQGDEVKQGNVLMIFVAMKMHNVVRAPFDGKVSAVNVKVGDKVPKGTVMIVVSRKTKISKEEISSRPAKGTRRKQLEKRVEKRREKRAKKIKK